MMFGSKSNPSKDLLKRFEFKRTNVFIFIAIFAGVGGISLWLSYAAPNPALPGDLNNDNTVNVTDLSILLTNYATTNANADINGDGTVSILDLSILLSHYGSSATPATSEIAPESVCPNQSTTSATVAQKNQAMICMTNYGRNFNGGLAPLAQNTPLMNAAASKANDIITCNEFSHTACGRPFDYWILQNAYGGRCYGENIAQGYQTVKAAFTGWMNSSGHRANILNASYHDIGVAVQGSGQQLTWVMELGGC